MRLVSCFFVCVNAASVVAFAPSPSRTARVSRVLYAEPEKNESIHKRFSKRKIALKTVKRVGGVLATFAAASVAALPAHAARKKAVAKTGRRAAKKAAKLHPRVTQAIDYLTNLKDKIPLTDAGKIGGAFVAATLLLFLLTKLLGKGDNKETTSKIQLVFPGAIPQKELIPRVSAALDKYGYGKSTSLLATSLAGDEVSKGLEKDFAAYYGNPFHLGGAAGVPFRGHSAFHTMTTHIPDGGSCLVVYGPQVGVDSKGTVGALERRGRAASSTCSGPAVEAASYVSAVGSKQTKVSPPPEKGTPKDAQQTFLGNMMLSSAPRLEKAADKMVEIPYALFDAQKEMMTDLVAETAIDDENGKVAVLGGIQISTPAGTSDYFKPMSFAVYDNTGRVVVDLTDSL